MTEPPLPRFFRLRQRFRSLALADVAAATQQTLQQSRLREVVRPGERVVIGTGSRGITDVKAVVSSVATYVRSLGAIPVLVPAMGSHGGATPEGQTSVLAGLGIDPKEMGCEVDASLDTVVVATTDNGMPIHFSTVAGNADHVIVVNRVKPHTRLTGDVQSGLCKMLMIGLGKRNGAQAYHQAFPNFEYQFDRVAREVIPVLLENMPITLGVAIVEDAFERTSHVEAIDPPAFLKRESELLKIAHEQMPRLPFERADLLIVDRIGKEISGTGMDTNVVGRKSNDRCAAPDEQPKIRQIYVRGLTEKTAGNATGIGIAEYCHDRLLKQMDVQITKVNCVTSNHVSAGAIPISYASDRELLHVAVSQGATTDPRQLRWIRIPDTLRIAEIACSEAFYPLAAERDDLEILSEPASLRFDEAGDLLDDEPVSHD